MRKGCSFTSLLSIILVLLAHCIGSINDQRTIHSFTDVDLGENWRAPTSNALSWDKIARSQYECNPQAVVPSEGLLEFHVQQQSQESKEALQKHIEPIELLSRDGNVMEVFKNEMDLEPHTGVNPPLKNNDSSQDDNKFDTIQLDPSHTIENITLEDKKEENVMVVTPNQNKSIDTEVILAPFSQWTEMKLEERKKNGNGKAHSKSNNDPSSSNDDKILKPSKIDDGKTIYKHKEDILLKNFANPACSAKVVDSTKDSKGGDNILSSSKDEYFINKCSTQSWFVVELCESIKVLQIQLANYELFSSSPKEFTVHVGIAYPTSQESWIKFGSFLYQDERNMQTFKNEKGVVGRYVKVEIFSHHGDEHFCPISRIKVMGIPEIELISEDESESEKKIEESLDSHQTVGESQTIFDESIDLQPGLVEENQQVVENETLLSNQHKGIDQVDLEWCPRFDIFPSNGDTKSIQTTIMTRYCDLQKYTEKYTVKNFLYWHCENFHGASSEDSKERKGKCKGPWKEGNFLTWVFSENFILALCNLLSIKNGYSDITTGEEKTKVEMPNVNTVNSIRGQETVNETKYIAETMPETHTEPFNLDILENEIKHEQGKTIKKDYYHPDNQAKNKTSIETPATKTITVEEIVESDSTKSPQFPSQTTWQKLSSRIKVLERNVSLATDFLEDMSRKYIKNMEEIASTLKQTQTRADDTSKQVQVLTESFNDKISVLEARIEILQTELSSFNWLRFFRCPNYKSSKIKCELLNLHNQKMSLHSQKVSLENQKIYLRNYKRRLDSCNMLSIFIFIELCLLFIPLICAYIYHFKYKIC